MSDATPEESKTIVYLDNAATSFPKPLQVVEATTRWFAEIGGSPGRSGHSMATRSARLVFEARESLAQLFNAPSSRQIVFTKNATESLNLAIQGSLRRGDHVVTTSMEHNSVMRPLRHLAASGVIDLEVIPCDAEGRLPMPLLEQALGDNTRLVVVTHASNVTGTIMPIREVGRICRARDILFLVDAAQTAGAVPLDVTADFVDLLAFTGHKSLFGPQGIGGLYLREGLDLEPLMRGGTGSNSEHEEQPDFLPDRLESGTLNGIGIAGLKAGVEFVLSTGVERIREEESSLTALLLEALSGVPGVTLYGPRDARDRTPVVSFTVDNLSPSEIGFMLDEGFGIMTRVGLHCAPSAHRTIGTAPAGTVRLCPGFFNTPEDMRYTADAVASIASRRRAG